MSFGTATAPEIDKKLRDDFRRRLKDFGVSVETTDPVLAVLFRTFASQIEAQYHEIDRLRLGLLDELITGLGIERRRARPAQTVVRFTVKGGTEVIAAGTELVGEAEGGEKLTFTTDASITVSRASITLAATYQDGWLRLVEGMEMPEALQAARPSFEPVRVSLGASPAIFFAVEGLEPAHVSGHSLFLLMSPEARGIQDALLNETWCLAQPTGEFSVDGILRPHRANAGVRALEWLRPVAPQSSTVDNAEAATVPDGFYSGRVFVFPDVPPSRRFVCKVPKGLGQGLGKLFSVGASSLFDAERAWIRISMPQEIPDLHTGLTSIMLHAVTASNVECFNQSIDFGRHGKSIPVSLEGGTPRHLVAPLSVVGSQGSAYLPEFEPSTDPGLGRYALRNGRIELRPARRADGVEDTGANLRLWVTAGSAGNRVGPGQVKTLLRPGSFSGLSLSNPTAAAGGTEGETLQETQMRFAEALLSRDRIVTRADLVAASRAIDRRILKVDVSSGLDRDQHGLRRVERVKVVLNRNDFLDPAEEGRQLQQELTERLGRRVLFDTELRVDLVWE
ncbi:MAG: baseplate J/gp47 family protein [Terriglobia bacterium]